MARIPDAEIERIKRQTDLAALVRSRGIELRRHGGNGHLAGKCPFHAEEEASFIVTPAKGLYHCMGCGAAGNAIQFVEKFDGVSFRHAFELLNDGPAAFTAPPEGHITQGTVRRLEPPVKPDAEDAELFTQVVDYYHERLRATPAALEYLASRGLYQDEAIERFGIGFADRTLGLRLPERNRKDGEAIRTRLQQLGLIRASGHEHFNGSIVLPIYEYTGRACPERSRRVAEMYGRKISRGLRKGTPLHLYLPGPHAGIWNAEALDAGELILCEAPLDALSFWVHGLRNVSFIYGTEGFPGYLFDALLARRVRTVRLAYDADEAGNRAAERDAERLTAHGIECYRVKFPWGMDANEYASKVTPAAKSLAQAVKAAEWLGGKAGGGSLKPAPQARVPRAGALSDESLAAKRLAAEEKSPSNPADPGHPAQSPPSLIRLGDYHTLTLGRREYRVGGLERNNSLEVLKVAVRIRHEDPALHSPGDARFHLDSFDMTRDGERRRFIERAAEETGLERELIKRDLGKLLLALEQAQQERLGAAVEPAGRTAPAMTGAERRAALDLLESPDLVGRIGEAFDACGLAGEETNRLAAYLACTSRKLDRPLAVIIQSTSAAGKSTLMEAVLSMFPEEERVQYSAMTGQSLYYLGETDLKHRILAIVEEEGAEKAGYALKLLQSEGELTIASTGKDPHTGRMETQEYHVEGPVMIFLTTTAVEIDEELLNRCLVLAVDESREQTARIHALQRQARTLEGLRHRKRRRELLTLLRNAQRLIEPLDVVNPWADQLTFSAERTRTRRDHEKYLTLIDAIALLHQHQRGRSQISGDGGQNPDLGSPASDLGSYITVTLEDIALANRLAPDLLGRSLDELLAGRMGIDGIDQRLAFFSRREVRDRLGWGITQIRTHLERLREMEFIAVRYGRPGSPFQYELLCDCRERAAADPVGLLDVEKLRACRGEAPETPGRVRREPVGENANLPGGCRPPARQVQPVEEPCPAANLPACSKRTSGPAATAVVS